MTKRKPHIRNIEELELHERKVLLRLKDAESEIKLRVKQLPEEIVTTAFMQLVSTVIEGKAIKTLGGILKKVGKSALSKLFEDKED